MKTMILTILSLMLVTANAFAGVNKSRLMATSVDVAEENHIILVTTLKKCFNESCLGPHIFTSEDALSKDKVQLATDFFRNLHTVNRKRIAIRLFDIIKEKRQFKISFTILDVENAISHYSPASDKEIKDYDKASHQAD